MHKLAMLIVLVLCSASLYSQTVRFPVGVYAQNNSLDNQLQLDSLGLDIVVQSIHNNYSLWNKFDLFALNDDINDYIHYYTCGSYNVWRASENNTSTIFPGIKHEIGQAAGGCWETKDNDLTNKYLVKGPDYYQNGIYQGTVPRYKGDTINYQADFQLKIEGNTTATVPVCELSVYYNDDSTVLASRVLLARDMSNSFAKYSLPYHYKISSHKIKGDDPREITDGYKPQGIQFRVKWLGNRKLIADSITVYDDNIGVDFTTPKGRTYIANKVKNYANAHIQESRIKYWMSMDEPHSNDNYMPYRIVDSILQTSTNYHRLITALYPEWDGVRNYENTIGRFISLAKPERLMFWYYPFWKDYPSDSAFSVQRIVFQRPFNDGVDMGNYYYVAQGCGFFDTLIYREYPTNRQMLASTMLALAHGTKGIIYWTYYSYKDSLGNYRAKGIVDVRDNNNYYPHLPLWDILHDNIIPRLHGSLGDNLLKLNYSGQWLHNNKTNFTFAGDTIPFVSFNDSAIAPPYDFHTGLLKDNENNNYLMNVNLITDSSAAPRVLSLDITNPTSYNNLRLKNVETGTDTTFSRATFTLRDTIQSGDGHLFSLLPVLKYGGKLMYSDTVKTSLTLNDTMTIYPNVTLTINNSYTVNKNITLKQNSAISFINNGGNLIISDSAKINSASWTNYPVKAQTLQYHPRIFWGSYASTSPVKYKIYRKNALPNYEFIKETTNLEFIDSAITINHSLQSGYDIYYRIDAIEITDEGLLTHQSNSLTYELQGDSPQKRQSNNNLSDAAYKIEQNYPNPFNPETKINYGLAEDGQVTIKVYDILGNEITTLLNEYKAKGNYSVSFNINRLKNLTSGVYFYTIRTGNFSAAKKMVILK